MIYDKIVFGVCLLLLLAVHTALAASHRRGDPRQQRVLHFLRAGLALSAVSYLLRLVETPHQGHLSFLSFAACLAGTTLIWLGWLEHWKMRWERLHARPVPRTEDEWDERKAEPANEETFPLIAGKDTLRLNSRARQVLLHAQHEAYRRHESCVDTDHLLLGLLHGPASAGVHILEVLGASPEGVHLELLGQMASRRTFTKQSRQAPDMALRAPLRLLPLTGHADQVLALAAHESHRFNKTSIGTEHLLLGLILVGKGKAAAVLFAQGVTVDGIRDQIIKARERAC